MTADFDTFWTDPRIPPEMKRCGKPPVRRALAKTGADPEKVLASLPGYTASLPDWQSFCHLSTYINAERFDIDYGETSIPEYQPNDRIKLVNFIMGRPWGEHWSIEKPGSVSNAKERLDALGMGDTEYGRKMMESKLRIVE